MLNIFEGYFFHLNLSRFGVGCNGLRMLWRKHWFTTNRPFGCVLWIGVVGVRNGASLSIPEWDCVQNKETVGASPKWNDCGPQGSNPSRRKKLRASAERCPSGEPTTHVFQGLCLLQI